MQFGNSEVLLITIFVYNLIKLLSLVVLFVIAAGDGAQIDLVAKNLGYEAVVEALTTAVISVAAADIVLQLWYCKAYWNAARNGTDGQTGGTEPVSVVVN